jgi:hypothetical protein
MFTLKVIPCIPNNMSLQRANHLYIIKKSQKLLKMARIK